MGIDIRTWKEMEAEDKLSAEAFETGMEYTEELYLWGKGRNDYGLKFFRNDENAPELDVIFDDGEDDEICLFFSLVDECERVIAENFGLNFNLDLYGVDVKKWYLSFVGCFRLFNFANEICPPHTAWFIAEKEGCSVRIAGLVYTYNAETGLFSVPHGSMIMEMDIQKLVSVLSTLKTK